MSPASYLTAPPRVAGSSIAPCQRGRPSRLLFSNTLLASPDLAPRPDCAGFPPPCDSGRRRLRVPARTPFPARSEERERDDRRTASRSRRVCRASVAEDGIGGVGGTQARGERGAPSPLGRPARRPARGAAGLARLVRVADRGVPAEVTRVAAVDLGTNTTRLLVADVDDGRVDEVSLRQQITRLGEGVHARRRLLPLPIARVRNVLTDFRREAESLGADRVLAVATSAVRDAENGEAFLGEIEWSYGFTTRLLTGEEEAALTLQGVGELAEGTLVLDVGGGSTELITHERAVSLDVGSVRLTELFGEEIDAIAEYVRPLLPDFVPSAAVGVAGTVTSLAALDLALEKYDRERVHGHVLTLDAVEEQLARLASLPLEERKRLPALDPGRAPVIITGATIVREVLRRYDLDSLRASERDLLHGIALAAAALPEPLEGDAPPGAYTCC